MTDLVLGDNLDKVLGIIVGVLIGAPIILIALRKFTKKPDEKLLSIKAIEAILSIIASAILAYVFVR